MKFTDQLRADQTRQAIKLALDLRDSRLESAVDAITARWPDVVPEASEKDRRLILRRVATCHYNDRWHGVKRQDVLIAARVAFAPESIGDSRLKPFRDFLIEQAEISPLSSLVRVMFGVYLDSYEPNAPHTKALSRAFGLNVGTLSLAERRMLNALPELADPVEAPNRIAIRLYEEPDPGASLRRLGLRDLYADGLMHHLHLAMIARYRIELAVSNEAGFEKFLTWLRPDGKQARKRGAGVAIDAALAPWMDHAPPADYQDQLVKGLVSVYHDPRLPDGNAWREASEGSRMLMVRWLTGSTMEIFLDAISRSNDEDMWKPRKEFWMDMYEAGHIDEAWVAFSEAAHRIARQMATSDEELALYSGFGKQIAGSSRRDTSLLIMRLGNRTVVEGSHNYKVHLFERGNPSRPDLYQSSYDCETIRKRSDEARPHSVGGSWQQWVREKVL